MRSLAQRSAKAAHETTDLIQDTIERVKNGSAIAHDTAAALDGIVERVNQVTGLIGEIAAASQDQSQGIREVTQGLSQIDAVTQANTASAEETAASARDLSGQAEQLRRVVAGFRLREDAWSRGGAESPQAVDDMDSATPRPTALKLPDRSPSFAPEDRPAPPHRNGSNGSAARPHIALDDDDDFGEF